MTALAPVELALPCRLVRLDLRVGPEQGVTTLEDLVARGILAHQEHPPDTSTRPRDTTEYLTWLFQVPERVIVDVIGSLWAKGFATVDFESGAVALSAEAMAKLSRGESLAAEGELQTREFLFEPITGLILPERMGGTRSPEGSVQLPLRPGVRESDIPQHELVRSVQAALRYERTRFGQTNVLQVGFGSPALHDPVKLRWLSIRVAARRDPDHDRISVEVVDDRLSIPVHAQQQLSDHISKLADEEPDHPVVQQLRGRAQLEFEPTPRLDDLIRKMGELTAGLSGVERSQVLSRHKVLAERAQRIRVQLTRMRNAQALITLITSHDGHAWAVNDLIEGSRSQLLLVAPSLDYTRMVELLPSLRKALDRGVQLVVMWGRAPNDTLTGKLVTLLDELQLRKGARVVRSSSSTQTEACLVVADDCRALVSSHSVLGTRPPGPREPAVLIEPAASGLPAPQAVINLLRWARSEFPRWSLGQRIEMGEDGTTGAVPAAVDPDAGRMDDWESADLDLTVMDDGALALWAERWTAVHERLAGMRDEILAKAATVEVVQDGEHRAVLWEELRSTRRQFVLVDDRISASTANASLARAIRDCRDVGASVYLSHPELPAAERAADSISSLRTGGQLTVRHSSDRGRVMVADDEVLIGSFSLLGEKGSGLVGRRVSQLGLRIRSEALAADVAALLGAKPVPPAPSDTRTLAGVIPHARSADTALSLLLDVRALAGAGEFGRIAADRLHAVADPLAVLAAWRDAKVDQAELRAAVAMFLADLARGTTGAEATPGAEAHISGWLRFLVEDAWRRDAFVEAAVLATRLPERERELCAAASLATALETGPVGRVVEEFALALDDSPGAQLAGAAGALAEVLRWGGLEGVNVLGLLAPDLSPHWAALCAKVEREVKSVPLPFAELTADQTRAETLRDLDQRRDALVAEIDKIEVLRNRFSFNAGIALHTQMLVSGGLLERIRTAAKRGNEACRLLAPELPVDVRSELDRLVEEAGEKPMEWLKHVHFLREIEDIVRSVRGISALASSGRLNADSGDRRLLTECLGLGAFLDAQWEGLYAEAKQQGSLYELPPLALLSMLNPLVTWTREQP